MAASPFGPALYAVFLCAVGISAAILTSHNKRLAATVAIVFAVSFLGRAILVGLNENLHFFAAKGAGDYALDLYHEGWTTSSLLLQGRDDITLFQFLTLGKFFPQALANALAVWAFEAERIYFLLSNTFFGAFSGVVAFAYLGRMFNDRAAILGLILFSVYPASVNFSIFGLRDIFIYLLMTILLMATLWIWLERRAIFLNGALLVASGLVLVMSRATFLPIFLMVPGLIAVRAVWVAGRRLQHKGLKLFVYFVAVLFIPATVILTGLSLFEIISAYIGFEHASLIEFLTKYTEARYERALEAGELAEGGYSHILPPHIYDALPLPVRIAIQSVGIVFVPMPWLITQITRALAALDSVFLIFLIVWSVYGARLATTGFAADIDKAKAVCRVLVFSFALSVILLGSTVSNAGNAFRLRMNIAPFVLVAASVYGGLRPYGRVITQAAPGRRTALRGQD